jgi:BirA family biotin operon repressor/biotin-[acetyl-CoA-carboxylase] ligase
MEFIWLKLIESLERHLTEFDQRGFASYQHQWEHWDAYSGQSVYITGANKDPLKGVAKGVDQYGALLLQQDNQTIAIHAGDVSLRVQS